MRKNLFSAALTVLMALPITFVASEVRADDEPAEVTFKGDAAKIKTYLEGLFEASKKVNSSATGERNTAREKIDGSMDWDQVAKDCLGAREWSKTAAANRKAYQELLREVIIKTAWTRLDTFWDGAKYKFTKITAKGNRGQATAVYTVKDEEFTLDYYVTRRGGSWAIYDIAFEDIRYSENIHEQIKAFLKEKGFPNLLAKLRKRRDELNEGKKGSAKSSQGPAAKVKKT